MHLDIYGKVNEFYEGVEEKVKASIVATLFIECNKKGIRLVVDDNKNFADLPPSNMPPPPTQGVPPPTTVSDSMNDAMVLKMMESVTPILVEAGVLMTRINSAKGLGALVDKTIVGWYVRSQGNDSVFKITANDELMKLGV